MAHFAQLDENNIVQQVLAVPDEQEHRGHEYLTQELGHTGTWVQCSYNTNLNTHRNGKQPFRGNFPAQRYFYDSEHDMFIPPKEDYPASFVFNYETASWEAPVPKPGNEYDWDEKTQSWIILVQN